MQTNIQNVYIDTCFFQSYLWKERDEKESAKDVLSQIKSSVIFLKNWKIWKQILFPQINAVMIKPNH